MRILLTLALLIFMPFTLAKKFTYGVDPDFMPFEWVDSKGELQGFNVELMRALARESGLEVEMQVHDWKSLVEKFRKGEIDCISVASHLDASYQPRFGSEILTVPHSLSYGHIYFDKTKRTISSIEDLAGLKVAVSENTFNSESLKSADVDLELVLTDSDREAMESLRKGRVDAALSSFWVGRNFYHEWPNSNIIDNGTPLYPRYYGYAILPRNQPLAQSLQLALLKVSERGELNMIRGKWFRSTSEIQVFDSRKKLFTQISLIGCAMFLVALLWNLMLRRSVEKRTAALRQQTELAERNARLAVLGTVSAGLAHEINNPNGMIAQTISGIRRQFRRLYSCLDKQEEIIDEFEIYGIHYPSFREQSLADLQKVADSSRRIHLLVNEFKDYARPGADELVQLLNIADVCRSTKLLCTSMIKSKSVSFDFVEQSAILKVNGSKSRLEQVLINLIQNAVHACPEKGGRITLILSGGARMVIIEVTDNGCGMSAHTLANATENFYTTRQDQGGLGLGLAICQRIIKSHKGCLSIESEQGKGTTVRIQLPIAAE